MSVPEPEQTSKLDLKQREGVWSLAGAEPTRPPDFFQIQCDRLR